MSNKEMTTEKRLKVRLYLSLLVYTVVGYGLTLILDYIFSKFDNGIFAWLYWRLDLLFILYLMLGFICIFNYYWKKPWGYLDEVIDATQTVYEQNNHTVSLSEPLKELEEQLNQIKMSVLLSKQAAKQAEEKKNEIIMYLAHDIRTPLTTVIGYLSLLHEAPDMPEQQKEKYVKVALNKAERLEKLINELFEITKYNAHTVIIKKETVDLHLLISIVVLLMPLFAYVAMGATWLSTILPSAGIGMQNNFLSQLADFNYLNIGGMSFWTPHVILISAGIELFVFTFLAIHSYCRHQVA